MSNNWLVMQGDEHDRHVIPNFGREHDLSLECWCKPKQDDDDSTVIVHWSHEKVINIIPRE